MSYINWVKVFESINNLLNSVLLYYESSDKLKIEEVGRTIGKIVLSFNMIWYLKILLASILTIVINSQLFN